MHSQAAHHKSGGGHDNENCRDGSNLHPPNADTLKTQAAICADARLTFPILSETISYLPQSPSPAGGGNALIMHCAPSGPMHQGLRITHLLHWAPKVVLGSWPRFMAEGGEPITLAKSRPYIFGGAAMYRPLPVRFTLGYGQKYPH